MTREELQDLQAKKEEIKSLKKKINRGTFLNIGKLLAATSVAGFTTGVAISVAKNDDVDVVTKSLVSGIGALSVALAGDRIYDAVVSIKAKTDSDKIYKGLNRLIDMFEKSSLLDEPEESQYIPTEAAIEEFEKTKKTVLDNITSRHEELNAVLKELQDQEQIDTADISVAQDNISDELDAILDDCIERDMDTDTKPKIVVVANGEDGMHIVKNPVNVKKDSPVAKKFSDKK